MSQTLNDVSNKQIIQYSQLIMVRKKTRCLCTDTEAIDKCVQVVKGDKLLLFYHTLFGALVYIFYKLDKIHGR